MNLTDLRDVLDERSATYEVEARSHLTLTGVQRRLKIRRRRRIAATAAAVVVVLAGAAGTLAVTHSSRRTPTAAPTVAMVGGFPEYAAGARVIAASALPVPRDGLLFTPTTTDLVFFERCDPPESAPKLDAKGEPVLGPMHYLWLNGHQLFGGTGCGGSWATNLTDPASGLLVGRANSLTVTFAAKPDISIAVAVGERVPVDQYVFPARPAELAPLDTEELDYRDPENKGWKPAVLRADPADPNQPVQTTVVWRNDLHLMQRSQTPGAVTVTVGGVTIGRSQWWDYGQTLNDGGYSADWKGKLPKPGQLVTVTVTPERMTGEWMVALQQTR